MKIRLTSIPQTKRDGILDGLRRAFSPRPHMEVEKTGAAGTVVATVIFGPNEKIDRGAVTKRIRDILGSYDEKVRIEYVQEGANTRPIDRGAWG